MAPPDIPMEGKHRKMKQAKPAGIACRKRPPKGFAMVASLTLLSLIALLACAILAQIASLNRTTGHDIVVTQARQQALVGLDAAIAELQETMGPDQRISAHSSILEVDSKAGMPHLLGVWDSWDAPLYGKRANGRSIMDTYTPGRRAMFRRWLISSRDLSLTRNIEAAARLCARKPGERICLLGEGTLGREAPRSHHVYADLLYMPLDAHTNGAFAWWVAGENQKAKISVPRAARTKHPMEVLRRTWDTPPAIPADYLSPKSRGMLMACAGKLPSVAGLALVGKEAPRVGIPYFTDYTTASYSLLTNAAHGGLKQDLCLLLNKDSLEHTEFAPTPDSDSPLVPEQWLPQERKRRFPIGSWQTMHAYYNCWPNASQKDEHVTTRLIGTVAKHHTRLGGSVFNEQLQYDASPENSAGTYLDARARQKGNAGAGYARSPVLLGFLCNVAMGVEKLENGENQLSLYYSPLFLWWNPYNVPMRIAGRRMWAVAAPYKTMPLESFANMGLYGRGWSAYGLVRPNETIMSGGARTPSPDLGAMSCLDGGEYFQNSLHHAYEDIVFRPGEVLVFTPGKNKFARGSTAGQVSRPGDNPWIPGYHADTVAVWHSPMYRTMVEPEQVWRETLFGLRFHSHPERLTDSRLMAGGVSDCISIAHGFGGISSALQTAHPLDASVNDISSEYGKHLHSARRFLLDWYSPVMGEGNRIVTNLMHWFGNNVQTPDQTPYYVASVGVVAKSANPSIDTKVYPTYDLRTKHWLHSSPVFWGSSIRQADHQQRQYHPYQLAVLPVAGGILSSPVFSVGRNGIIGITEEGEQVSFASVAELPVHPPFSLAGFAGMRLHPGWFRGGGTAQSPHAALQRMQYQSGVPGVGIGNAFADPCLPPDKVYAHHAPAQGKEPERENIPLQNEFYDHALLINDALWDRWFCSSVSDMPGNDAGRTIPAQVTLERFLLGEHPLPVSRYVRARSAYNSKAVLKRIMQGDGWKIIAAHLMVNGGFNVNSTSVPAWKAVLQGLASRQLVTAEGGSLHMVEASKPPMNVSFSRFMLSTTDKSTDSVASYSPMQGSEIFRSDAALGTAAWSEVRMLKPADIARLAEEMVRQVRARGPFLSMSDFINRRLDAQGGEAALKGALQAAIDRTDINRDFREVQISPREGSLYRFPKAEQGDLHTAAPGYLIQSDVLASLGNILCVRDDTFTIRSYGCVRNKQGAILSQCWCEATVQRSLDYVDPTDAPSAAEFSADLKHTAKLSPLNRILGRRFRVTSFKWLDIWDL